MLINIDGRWHLDIQPGGRGCRRYRKWFKTKAEARRFEIHVSNKVQNDSTYSIPAKDNRTLNEFVDIWFQNTGKHLSSGADSYQRMVQASFSMGSPVMRLFKPVLFLEYRSQRIGQGISPSTLNRELQTFKTVFNDLIQSGQFVGKNPFLTIKKIRVQQPKTRYLTYAEIVCLFSHLEKADSDAYLIALVCLSTGARWGEAQGLCFNDLSNNMIHLHETKSKKHRSIPVSKKLYLLLVDRLKKSSFTDSYSTFTRRLSDSGIDLPKGQRTHVLRHTFASHYIMNGGNILALKEILGHSSLEMTMKYSHLAPDYLNEILKINPALSIR